jgi:IclR family KDG regulon transcriptional repressor
VINGNDAVFLDKVEGEQTIRVHTPSGSRIPLQCGSAAKVLLAFQPAELIERVVSQLTPVTRFTITDPALLRRELANIFARGYAIGEQEWRLGVSGVAAPVRNPSGSVIAAIAISGPSERLPRSRLQALSIPVMDAALRLSQALGWRPEPCAARALRTRPANPLRS